MTITLSERAELDEKIDRATGQIEKGEFLTPEQLKSNMQRFKAEWLVANGRR